MHRQAVRTWPKDVCYVVCHYTYVLFCLNVDESVTENHPPLRDTCH
jgi:hypothetical protein